MAEATDHDEHHSTQHVEHSATATHEAVVEGVDVPQADAARLDALLGSPRLDGRGNAPVRAAVMRQAQQRYGNRAVQRYLRESGARHVQRHPAGAELLPGSEEVIEEDLRPPEAQNPLKWFKALFTRKKRSGKGTEQAEAEAETEAAAEAENTAQTGNTATAETTESTGTATAETTENTAVGETAETTETAATANTETGTTETSTPTEETKGETKAPEAKPVSPYFMELSKAQEVLQAAFGSDKRKIVPGNIVTVDDNAAIWDKYDEVCIADNLTNPRTKVKWAKGDAKVANPFGLNGFAWKGVVYINKQTTLATTTLHEMLHINAEKGWRTAVGEQINEGATEYLSVLALEATKVKVTAWAYVKDVDFVKRLAEVVGLDLLKNAYFDGAKALIDAVDKAKGAGTFDKIKAHLAKEEYNEAKELLKD
jgi:hypothetical protein